jgi:pSer/pThr/pTyr-binding forkhead associated (FHA) protein
MKLSVQIQFDKTLDLETAKSDVVVGRSQTCDLAIPHESISRNHCRVEIVKGAFYITDLDSSNGTFIEGRKLDPHKRMPFDSKSNITIGKLDCEFSFEAPGSETIARTKRSKAEINKNATMTTKTRRLDLNKPSITLEMEKKNNEMLLKGPQNPITHGIEAAEKLEYKTPRKKYLILFLILGAINDYRIRVATH